MATPRKDWKKEWEAVQKESRKLAKRANQRLVRLERYSEKEGYSEILKYAYEVATNYIKTNLVSQRKKPSKLRFKENVVLYDLTDGNSDLDEIDNYKANVQLQRHRIKEMKKFLESETSVMGSSKFGIKRIYDERTHTINDKFLKKYGLKMSDNDLKRFFESKKQAKLESVVGSGKMFVVASVMKKYNLKSNKRELEKFMKSHIDLSKNNLSKEDIKAKKGESYEDYLDRLRDYVHYTKDDVLNDMVNKALKAGVNSTNIFI